MSAELLRCSKCGAAVPLRSAPTVPCGHCDAIVELPDRFRRVAETHQARDRLRAEVEPRWAALTRAPSRWIEVAAASAVVVVPPVATVLVQALAWPPPAPVATLGFVAVPCMLPGALAWLWTGALAATVVNLRHTLGARRSSDSQDLGCRSCGAPLRPEPRALACTCTYCGTDSLVVSGRKAAVEAFVTAQRDAALRSLADATRALSRRRIALALGLVGLGVGVAAMSSLAALAFGLAALH